MTNNKEFISTTELAKMLGISRIAVFNRIKTGKIKAVKIGRNYAIKRSELSEILGGNLSEHSKEMINQAVDRTVREYGETLRLLGAE